MHQFCKNTKDPGDYNSFEAVFEPLVNFKPCASHTQLDN